ncbi:MAG: hypothetical protein HY690_04540 [Chloroflexi bacterium]|nr:hypothetical protein [Chloroflexota bacterium]
MRVFRVSAVVALALVLACVASVPSPASADPWERGPAGQGDSTIDGVIDLPVVGSTVPSGLTFVVTGWVVDTSAQGWAGIDEAHLYDGRAGEGGTFLGQGLVALSRPDVGAALGNPYYAASGFGFVVDATRLAPGSHNLTVYARTPGRGWWSRPTTITVSAPAIGAPASPSAIATPAPTATPAPAAESNIQIRVIEPVANSLAIGRDQLLKGWALDLNCKQSTTGVDRVQVYLDAEREKGRARYLGSADYGNSYGSPEAEFRDDRFTYAGFGLLWSPTNFSLGQHEIYVYAHSACTDTWQFVVTLVEIAD